MYFDLETAKKIVEEYTPILIGSPLTIDDNSFPIQKIYIVPTDLDKYKAFYRLIKTNTNDVALSLAGFDPLKVEVKLYHFLLSGDCVTHEIDQYLIKSNLNRTYMNYYK